jgi:hypothetical protein
MNHKRKRPKNRRAGCLLCKPWKANGVAVTAKGGEKFSDRRRRTAADSERPARSAGPFFGQKLSHQSSNRFVGTTSGPRFEAISGQPQIL